jgi:hypothetical protein
MRKLAVACVVLVPSAAWAADDNIKIKPPAKKAPAKQRAAEKTAPPRTAAEKAEKTATAKTATAKTATAKTATAKTAADSLLRLDPQQPLWLDKRRKRVVLVGQVCLREGQLEMFACPTGTKEHESVVAVPVDAWKIHTALLAAGAEPGHPAMFQPDYQPAAGTEIDVSLFWTDEAGRRRSAWAQDWVRNALTGESLSAPWVFAGSGFWVDDATRKRTYLAEQGDLICVSNFSAAMLDLPIASSDEAGQLQFVAYTERIPSRGTKVTVVLTPRPAKQAQNDAAASEKPRRAAR